MPLHPQIRSFLKSQPPQSSSYSPTVEELRLRNAEMTIPLESRPAIYSLQDDVIIGAKHDLPIRIYTPEPDGEETYPLLMFLHGGGFVLGDLDTHDVICRNIANYAKYKVISVNYRLAPEHPFPAAIEDCYMALEWIHNHSNELDVDAARISVGGDSAGGNLAAAVCQMGRDRYNVSIANQVLIYPVIDYFSIHDDCLYESFKQYDEFGLSRLRMSEFWRYYIGHLNDKNNPYASPIKASHLRGLPPALVITAEYDVLCDEGESYAQRLKRENIETVHRRIKGVNHGFLNRFYEIDQSEEVYQLIAKFLNRNIE
ncbi:alpha/beta hydrolase [Bacillus sp. Marseille-P3661]|uniref:alpha/beta hydrolase n=1 Tax=Bacillus sp. Marseille-P3661 TaxID=1936234 RepID=UPI000C83C01F|nr:alpha/beta hydrolase [Bacillus sp. Marseille-P3661]